MVLGGITMRTRARGALLGVIILLVVVLGIVAVGLYLYLNNMRAARADFIIQRSPLLKTEVVDGRGESHSVTARFGVEIDIEQEDSVDVEVMFDNINRALADLDYDILRAEEGMELDYIKAQLMASLERQPNVNTDAISAIYVTDFITDFEIPTESLPSDSRPAGEVFRGLFGGGGSN
jgi:flagellar basal body-associated protein FliL